MKRIKVIAAIFFLMFQGITSLAQEIWTIGPMLHVNFGGDKRTVSFAIEAAYWKMAAVPYSVDFGIEFDRRKTTRIYSELQTGIGVTGVSVGPVFQINKGARAKLGIQGTCWLNYYIGIDYRMRFFRGEKVRAAGLYAKAPIATSGIDDGDGDDWDWDD